MANFRLNFLIKKVLIWKKKECMKKQQNVVIFPNLLSRPFCKYAMEVKNGYIEISICYRLVLWRIRKSWGLCGTCNLIGYFINNQGCLLLSRVNLDSPKSVNLIFPSLDIRRLSGLRSLFIVVRIGNWIMFHILRTIKPTYMLLCTNVSNRVKV